MGNIHSGRMLTQEFLKALFLDHFTFLIYINDLSNGVSSNCTLFANDTSLFPVVNDIKSIAATLLNDSTVISNWTFLSKWFLILIWLNKRKRWCLAGKLRHCFTLVFHFITFLKEQYVWRTSWVDNRRKVELPWARKKYHSKIRKTMCQLRQFQPILPGSSLLTIYKTWVR